MGRNSPEASTEMSFHSDRLLAVTSCSLCQGRHSLRWEKAFVRIGFKGLIGFFFLSVFTLFYLFIYLFCRSWGFSHIRGAQDLLLLTLCSGISPEGAQRTSHGAGDWTWVSGIQGKCFSYSSPFSHEKLKLEKWDPWFSDRRREGKRVHCTPSYQDCDQHNCLCRLSFLVWKVEQEIIQTTSLWSTVLMLIAQAKPKLPQPWLWTQMPASSMQLLSWFLLCILPFALYFISRA